MAEGRESTILDVKLDAGKVAQDLQDLITRIAALKAQQKELNDEIKAGNDVDGKYAEQLIRVKDQLAWTEKQAKGLSATTKLLNADTLTYSDSLNGERQKLADMQKAYDQLDKAQRESEGGKAFLEAIKAQSDAVKGLEEETGRAQRNVGNYPKTITAMIPGFEKFTGILNKVGVSMEDFGTNAKSAFKAAGQGMANLGKQAMSLLANPIIAAIAAVLVVLQQLYEAFQRSEAAQNAWQKALAPFKAMWQNFQRIFDDLVKLIMQIGNAFGANGKILEWYMRYILFPLNVAIGALRVVLLALKQDIALWTRVFKTAFDTIKQAVQKSPLAPWFDKIKKAVATVKQAFIDFGKKVREVMDKIENSKIGQFLGLAEYEKGMREIIGANNELVESNKKIAESEANLAKQRRANIVADANDTRDIAELRAKAAQKDKYNQQERLKFLEEANAKEEAIAKRAYELAKEKYEAEKLRNSLTESNAEDLEREAQAYADMVATETAYFNKQKELAGQIAELRQKDAEDAKKRQEERKRKAEEARKAEAEAEKARLENAKAIAQQAEDFAISLIEDETARTIAQRKIQGEREIAALKDKLEHEKNLTAESREQLAQLIKGKQAALDRELEQMATDAANALTEEQVKAEQERAQRILEYKRELAAAGSEEELAIQQELLDLQLAQELENVELSEEEKFLIRETFAKKRAELDKQYHDDLVKQAQDARNAYKESLKATAASASQTFGAMSDLLSSYGEENEAAAKASKAFGIAQIITDQAISIADTAKAISAAVAGATAAAASTGPAAPFVLAGYIAAMVGAVLGALGSIASTIAQAKQLMASADTAGKDAGKFAGGGTVPGTSYTGDKLIAHVNSGEGIYTGTQANNLLQEIANNPARGGFDYEGMADAMAAAVAAQPAPVVVYKELQEFGQKISTFNEIASV